MDGKSAQDIEKRSMKTRTCYACKRRLPETTANFSFRSDRGTFQGHCKSCHKDYRRRHYLKNKKKYIDKARRWSAENKRKMRMFAVGELRKRGCIDCGNKDIRVLDFDHREGCKRVFSVAVGINSKGQSFERVVKEIAKCDVRCANCRRIKTAERLGYWSSSRKIGKYTTGK